MNTLELLEIAAAIVPDRTALLSAGVPDRAVTFAGLRDRAGRLAAGLAGLRVEPGDRVAHMDVNGPEHIETYFACAQLGAIYVPLNFRARTAELEWMLGHVAPRVVIAGARYAELIESAAPACARRIIVGAPTEGWLEYESALAEQALTAIPEGSDEDATLILFTSGATARPKSVPLTHSSFCHFVLENVAPADPDAEERTLLSVPLYHVAGFQTMMAGIYAGRVTVLQPQFEPEEWLRLVERERVNRAMMVPTMLKSLLDHPRFGDFDLSSLRVLTYGAAPMSERVILEAIERLPGVQFMNAFGQTETAATITMLPPEDHVLEGTPEEIAKKRRRLRSIGRPLPDVEVRVVDEGGGEVSVGTVGEIVARGPRVMKGYWNPAGAPDDARQAVRDGWVYTGDLGRRDEDGYIYLEGRAKEFMKRGGEMISPQEVEETLGEHPSVAEAAVLGVPDETWGEVVHAVVVLRPGKRASEAELVEFCRERLASFKKPEKVHFASDLPRNALGKILRPQLRERLGSGAGTRIG